MTKPTPPLPNAGGSFIRNPDDSLTLRPADPETALPEAEHLPEKPAAKGDKQPVKEA